MSFAVWLRERGGLAEKHGPAAGDSGLQCGGIEFVDLHRNYEFAGKCAHPRKANITRALQRGREVRKIVELCEMTDLSVVIYVGDDPILGVVEDIGVYGGR